MPEEFHREQTPQELYLDDAGREIPNPVPMQPPIGYVKTPTMAETMRQMIQQVSYEAAMAGAETFEEWDDFDVDADNFEREFESRHIHELDRDRVMEEMIAMRSRSSRPPTDKDTQGRDKAPAAPQDNSKEVPQPRAEPAGK